MIYILASTNPLDHIIGVLIFLVSNIYHIAAWAFEVFLVLSTGQILDSEKYSLIIQNFYIVLGVVLLFFLSFSLLKGIVDPDDNKQGGSVIKTSIINLVTSVIILALLPTIFGFLYDFQTSFITKYNVIGRFFGYGNLGTPTSTKDTDYICQMDNESIKQGAFQITNGVFTAFFNVNSEKCSTKVNSLESLKNCQNDVTPKDDILFITWSSSRPSFYETVGRVDRNGFFSSYIDFSTNVREGDISFNFILSLIAGLLLIYVGISYSLDMALRMVKLVFYQIIAPIPIFARVVPDGPLKGSFEKWLKIVLACYLEVYIRILSFYFVVYLCVAMLDSSYIGNIFLCFNPVVGLLTRAFLLMGMVMFMKQAPKLIGDATGLDTGNMKLGIREKLKDGGFFTAASALGAAAQLGVRGALDKDDERYANKWGRVRAALKGVGAGLVRGGKAGLNAGSWSDMKSATAKSVHDYETAKKTSLEKYRLHGGKDVSAATRFENAMKDVGDSVKAWAGIDDKERLQRLMNDEKTIISAKKTLEDNIENDLLDAGRKGDDFSFGVAGMSTKKLHELYNKMQTAQYNGNAEDFAKAEEDYNKYKKKFVDSVAANTLQDQKGFESVLSKLSDKERVSMIERRTDADNFKFIATKLNGSKFIQDVNARAARDHLISQAGVRAEQAVENDSRYNTDANWERIQIGQFFQHPNSQRVQTAMSEATAQFSQSASDYFDTHVSTTAERRFDAVKPQVVSTFETQEKANVIARFDTSELQGTVDRFNRTQRANVETTFDTTLRVQQEQKFETQERANVVQTFETDEKANVVARFNETMLDSVKEQYAKEKSTIVLTPQAERQREAEFVESKLNEYIEQAKGQFVDKAKEQYVLHAKEQYVTQEREKFVNQEREQFVAEEEAQYIAEKHDEYIANAKEQYVSSKIEAEAQKIYLQHGREEVAARKERDKAAAKESAEDARRKTVTEQEIEAVLSNPNSGMVTINYETISDGSAFVPTQNSPENDANGRKIVRAGDSIKPVGKESIAEIQMKLNKMANEDSVNKDK